MILTQENYFSPEAQKCIWVRHNLKRLKNVRRPLWQKSWANLRGRKTVSLLVGSYVDAHFEGTLDVFKAKNPQIFTRNGELKSEYRKADTIIQRIERDSLFMDFMSGEKQVIKTGEIEGIPVKIKMDSYFPGKKIVDLKIMKDFEPVYVAGKGRLNFIEAWEYDIQAAFYQMIEGNNLPFYIAAATKETVPDIAIIQIPQENIEAAKEFIRSNIVRYNAIKEGYILPERCEHCDYCKHTKVLTAPIDMEELDYYAE